MIPRGAATTLLTLLLAGAPAPAQVRKSTGDPELDRRVNVALFDGTNYLVDAMVHLHGGKLALALFAALEGGAKVTRSTVRSNLDRIIRYQASQTYTAGLVLMIYQKYGGKKARKALLKTAKNLLSWQNRDGGWGYGAKRTRSDASNTQYALLGLRAALVAGVKVPRSSMERCVGYLLRTKGQEGGFGYTAGMANPTGTMTAGTVGSLEICKEICGARGMRRSLGKKLESASRLGVWWLQRRLEGLIGGGRNVGMRKGYFLYALERAMVLKGIEALGKVSWYRLGAAYLVERQGRSGAWGKDPITTAFAVLFLGRTFRPLAAITGLSPEASLLRLKKGASRQAVEALVARLAQKGVASVEACLKVLRGPSLIQRRAAAMALQRITGIRTGFDPAGKPESPANQEAARRWERWWMTRRGSGAAPVNPSPSGDGPSGAVRPRGGRRRL